jgi:predicted double-glycine peptidase
VKHPTLKRGAVASGSGMLQKRKRKSLSDINSEMPDENAAAEGSAADSHDNLQVSMPFVSSSLMPKAKSLACTIKKKYFDDRK